MKLDLPLALLSLATVAAAASSACSGDSLPPREQALTSVKAFVASNLGDLATATERLAAAAPAPDADGWNAADDAAAVATMRGEWKKARVAYEHIEGAIAVLFPDLDYSTDQRYDAFLADLGPDDNLFDDQGVTGVHAIERILWADASPARVQTFEAALPGYHAAAFPATAQEATDFKTGLCRRLADDVKTMRAQFGPLALDSASAFRGVIGSMGEQLEKAELAATGEEESRYAAFTLADMRSNVAAGKATFDAFRTWLSGAPGGPDLIVEIDAAFGRVTAAYAALPGDALPPVPESWSSKEPTADDLATPFGALWTVLHAEAEPEAPGSLVFNLGRAATLMMIPQLPARAP